MACSMTIDQIVDNAVKIEKAGRKFYSNLAIREYNRDIRDVLVFLAQEEVKHEETFEKLRGSLEAEASCTVEQMEYLEILMKTHLFFKVDVDDAEEKINNSYDALLMALTFERDSIVVFQEMKELVGKKGKEVLDELIAEERKHIRTLSQYFKKASPLPSGPQ